MTINRYEQITFLECKNFSEENFYNYILIDNRQVRSGQETITWVQGLSAFYTHKKYSPSYSGLSVEEVIAEIVEVNNYDEHTIKSVSPIFKFNGEVIENVKIDDLIIKDSLKIAKDKIGK